MLHFSYQLFIIGAFFLLLVLCVVACGGIRLLGRKDDLAHRVLVYWAKANLFLSGLSIRVDGLERLDPTGTCVFMPNHSSFLDILLALAYIPRNLRIVTKEELFRIPLIGWALRASGQLPMDRSNPRKGLKALKQAAALLQEGVSIVVFPEGTRTPDGRLQDLKGTIFVLPIRSRVPVVPVVIRGTFEALGKGQVLLNPVPISVTFSDPVMPGTFTDRDRCRYAERVRELLQSSPLPRSTMS